MQQQKLHAWPNQSSYLYSNTKAKTLTLKLKANVMLRPPAAADLPNGALPSGSGRLCYDSAVRSSSICVLPTTASRRPPLQNIASSSYPNLAGSFPPLAMQLAVALVASTAIMSPARFRAPHTKLLPIAPRPPD